MARKLFSELDILTARKLRAPQNEEVAIGAIMEEEEKTLQLEEIRGRVSLYHDDT